ncbi:MAG: glycosyltransferase [Deltaproteobacteria bacterium]|nr:glycosyltransferase [Deltaproteobacteria bacterium]
MKEDKKRQRIYVVTPFENLMAARGTRLPRLAEMLFEAGHEVEYVTTNFSHAYKRVFPKDEINLCESTLPYQMTLLAIPGYRSNISAWRVFSNVVMTFRHFFYLSHVLRSGDTIVAPSRPVEIIAMVALLKSMRRIRVVLDIRDVWPDALQGIGFFKKIVFSIYCNLYLKPSLKHIDTFVHIAPSFVKWLHRYAPKADSTFIPPGFDSARWVGMELRRLANNESISLVFIGALQYQLDAMPLLNALVDRPRFSLTLLGDNGTGQRYLEVKKFIEKHRMSNIKLKGRMTPEEVVKELRGHDIGVVPMISSSLTNKMFDYIAAYLPVISLGDNDSSDFVRHYDIGWTAPFEPEIIGNLLDALTAEEVNRKAKNVQAIRDQFDRKYLYKRFVDIVEGIG